MPSRKPRVRVDDVLLDRCHVDEELDAALLVVTDTGRDPAERAGRALSTVTARRGDVERQLLAQEALAPATRDLHAELVTAARAGATPADVADAAGLAAGATVHAAWGLREAGPETAPDPARAFHALVEEADDLALDGLRAVPDHPGCALARLVTARVRGVPGDEVVHRFDVARREEPLCFPAHLQMLQAVSAKWRGSHDAMFDLVRQTSAVVPPGHPTTAVLPVAHLEYLAAGERDATARREKDAVFMAALSEPLLAAGDEHPRAVEAHNAFGWFFAAVDDKRRARLHLARTGQRPSWLWAYLADDPRTVYVEVLQQIGAAR
ncbi:hypothetical protein [Jannaschia sp. R86511]|uniref:hypothetical protein n=1 Tax=Jannaschia sp. R86511 TaxID=3093853 RepID=UPI0036D3127D